MRECRRTFWIPATKSAHHPLTWRLMRLLVSLIVINCLWCLVTNLFLVDSTVESSSDNWYNGNNVPWTYPSTQPVDGSYVVSSPEEQQPFEHYFQQSQHSSPVELESPVSDVDPSFVLDNGFNSVEPSTNWNCQYSQPVVDQTYYNNWGNWEYSPPFNTYNSTNQSWYPPQDLTPTDEQSYFDPTSYVQPNGYWLFDISLTM